MITYLTKLRNKAVSPAHYRSLERTAARLLPRR